MTCNCYDAGSSVVLTAQFTLPDGTTPADPTTVKLRVLDPNGVETTPTPTKNSVGNYSTVINCLTPGVWFYRFEGAGAVTATMDNNFSIAATPFADAAA